ncbi:hypothetical protein IIC65_05155, partial [Candidatus Sumerlaeota bacterium]|nr:hypothetical protein [Candidatus Sumerlaeota bacterium]
MRRVLLVAMREYAENARTKGFWIGILMFPLILTIALRVPQFLESRATPTRHFVLIDQAGTFEDVIVSRLERDERTRALQALGEYARKYTRPELLEAARSDVDWEKLPAEMLTPEEILDDLAERNPRLLEFFGSEQSLDAMLSQMKPQLRDDAPEFELPRRKTIRVELPADVDPAAEPKQLAEALRPYLTGDQDIEVDGESVELFAAIIIPADIHERIRRPGMIAMPGEDSRSGVQFWSTNLADTDLRDSIERSVNEEVRRLEYARRDVDAAIVADVQRTRVQFATLNPKKAEGEEAVSAADVMRQWAPVGFVYLLWIAIVTISQMLLNNTIEEKSNRIIEVLLSSLTPGELMMGKLVGIAAI